MLNLIEHLMRLYILSFISEISVQQIMELYITVAISVITINQLCVTSQSTCDYTSLNEFFYANNHSSCSSVNVTVTENTSLSTVFSIENISSVSIVGSLFDRKPTVECHNGSGLFFKNIVYLEMRNLVIYRCGLVADSTSTNVTAHGNTWKIKSSVYISTLCDIVISDIAVVDSEGVGIVVVDSDRLTISNCSFKSNKISSNKIDVYPGGGGLHIEFNTCKERSYVYHIEECRFDDNIASVPLVNMTSFVKDGTIQHYGRGGGLFFAASENSGSIYFHVHNCTFKNNEAVWGGGFFFNFKQVQNIIVTVSDCVIDGNRSPMFGGGGALVQYLTGSSEIEINDSILFERCVFKRNTALFSGGLQFLGGLIGPVNGTVDIGLVNCEFLMNSANASAAVDITNIKHTVSNSPLSITFTDCCFVDNMVIDRVKPIENSSALQVESGTGTFVVLYHNVTFSEKVVFENNKGTALYIIAGFIRFESRIEARFVNNIGHNGGAIALMVSSMMYVNPNSYFHFIGNRAVNKGGAIFALNIGLHKLHRLVVTTCFIGECSACKNNVNLYFFGNKAGNSENVIFSDNLSACHALCDHTIEELLGESVSPLSCFGNMYSCNTSNCSATMPLQEFQVRGPASEYRISDNLPTSVIPGHKFQLPLDVYDFVGNKIDGSYYVAELGGQLNESNLEHSYINNSTIEINGHSRSNTTLVLHRVGFYSFQLKLNLSISACPPGFKLIDEHCMCSSQNMNVFYSGVLCNERAEIIHGIWIGYQDSYYTPDNLYTSLCPTGFCTYNTSVSSYSYVLPLDSAELEYFICGGARRGRACGECATNNSVYFHSPRFSCRSDTACKHGWLWYILSELFPITVVYIIVVVFNISFTSGSANAFIFFSQVIDTLEVNANGINGLSPSNDWIQHAHTAYSFIYKSFNLEFFGIESLSFCLWEGAGTLDILIMKYVTVTYAFLLVVVTVFILNRFRLCCRCPASERSHIIHGLSAFLITCYVQCMRVSFRILLPTHVTGLNSSRQSYSIVFYSGHLDYLQGRHLYYAIPAFVCVVFIVIVLPMALVLYPLYLRLFSLCGLAESKAVLLLSIPFEKAKPLFDSFQSSYKDNFRFVAGLFFIYRLGILLSYALSIGFAIFYLSVGIQFAIMMLLHFLMQPHRIHYHNVLDVLIFANLSAINIISLYRFGISYQKDPLSKLSVKGAGLVQLVLIFLPLVIPVVLLCVKVVRAVHSQIVKRTASYSDDLNDDIGHSSVEYRSIRLASFN